MTATLAPHAMTVAEMLDKQALRDLAATYCHAIDRGDLALVRSLYHDDAVDDHSPMFVGSADEYVAWLPSILSHWQLTSHIISNALYLIDGDAADGQLWVTAYHRTKDGTRELISYGRYLDRYAKRAGIWRFLERSLVLDWMENRTVDTGAMGTFADGAALGTPGNDDPCYRRLPLFATDRAREPS